VRQPRLACIPDDEATSLPLSSKTGMAHFGARILRSVIIGLLALLLVALIHTGLLYPSRGCLGSLDMKMKSPVAVEKDHAAEAKVDVYVFSLLTVNGVARLRGVVRCLSCQNAPMRNMRKLHWLR